MQGFKSKIFTLTILFLMVFLSLSAVSASDDIVSDNQFDEAAAVDYLYEIYEFEETQSDDDYSVSLEISSDEIIHDDSVDLAEYGDAHIDSVEISESNINFNCFNDENVDFIEVNVDDIDIYDFSNDSDSTGDIIILNSVYFDVCNDFILYSICHEIYNLEIDSLESSLFKSIGFKDFHLLNHGILIFSFENVSYHDINEQIIISSIKVTSNFAYSIDNSIVNSFIKFNCNEYSFFNFYSFSVLLFNKHHIISLYLTNHDFRGDFFIKSTDISGDICLKDNFFKV